MPSLRNADRTHFQIIISEEPMLDPFAAFALMLILCTAALALVATMSRRERQLRSAAVRRSRARP